MNDNKSVSDSVPRHVGIILDGNRRWAEANGKPKLEGHKAGLKTLEIIGEAAQKAGVKYLSAYVFSKENWNREKSEINYLMELLVSSALADSRVEKLDENGVKIVFVGSKEQLSNKVIQAMEKAEEKTAQNDDGVLALHFNYGGKTEIMDAVRTIVEEGIAASEITEETVADHLYAPELPAADLIIRTSGEQRLSNFMMWRSAYSELYFTDKYWPDFTPADLDAALEDYANRQRRHGK